MIDTSDYVQWFEDIRREDVVEVGQTNASSGELYREAGGLGLHVPNGFALTARAFTDAMEQADVVAALHKVLIGLDVDDAAGLAVKAAAARSVVYDALDDASLRKAVGAAYTRLEAQYGPQVAVAVRGSDVTEDMPPANQHDSFLNITGADNVMEACRRCFASLFTERAIVYRARHGLNHFTASLSVGVAKMVRADKASSGVIFTLDPESGLRDVVLITGSYGLGEAVVQGKVDPDEYFVHKPTFAHGHRTVLRRVLGRKQRTVTLVDGPLGSTRKDASTPSDLQVRFCLSDGEVMTLAGHAIDIESHYGRRTGNKVPMMIEWAKDGETGRLFIVQALPETVSSRRTSAVVEIRFPARGGLVLATGKAVGETVGSGSVRVVRSAGDLRYFQPGEVLVAQTTSPQWEAVMETAAAIVTDRGGRSSHAAAVARELGVPTVVGAVNATSVLRTGTRVTVSCADGSIGTVYDGDVPFTVTETDLRGLTMPKTAVMVNLDDPDQAFRVAMMPGGGVGLARMEFIIAQHIGIHPMALVYPERVPPRERVRIFERAAGFVSPQDYFVRTLAEGVGTIAAAFFPKPVIVRLSALTSEQYAELLGGTNFERRADPGVPGLRSASRYAHPRHAEGFALECEALRRVRDDMGLTNLVVLVPVCRRLADAEQVLAAMTRNRLERGKNGLQIHVMCEIPDNVSQVDAFAELFDGFAIASANAGSGPAASDLHLGDAGVQQMLRLAVGSARRQARGIGVIQAVGGGDPDAARILTEAGVDSISVGPSSLMATIAAVKHAEVLVQETVMEMEEETVELR